MFCQLNDIDAIVQKWTDTIIDAAYDYIPNMVVIIRPWDTLFFLTDTWEGYV